MTVQARRRDATETAGIGLRVGFTVTKRVGHAPERNRIRRRLRAAAALALAPYRSAGIDLVVIGRRSILKADFISLTGDLDKAMRALERPKPPKAGLAPVSNGSP
jgi:ribonuclease P protein component